MSGCEHRSQTPAAVRHRFISTCCGIGLKATSGMDGERMRRSVPVIVGLAAAALALAGLRGGEVRAASHPDPHKDFHTADRCVACHNGLKTPKGEDVSIGLQWRASVMGKSARDPYWQGSGCPEAVGYPPARARPPG